jgi:hypothetical protein
MAHPECVIVTNYFIIGSEIQIKTSDGELHVCKNVPGYDLERLNLHLKQVSREGRRLIFVSTLTTEVKRFHFTWTVTSILSPEILK